MRRGPFRRLRGVPDKILQTALSNHQDVLQQLVMFAANTQPVVVRTWYVALVALTVAVVALGAAGVALVW